MLLTTYGLGAISLMLLLSLWLNFNYQEKATPFPFNMIEKMMPMYPMIAVVGWMIVLIAFLVGLFTFAPAQFAFFSEAKAVREATAVGSAFVDANVASHVIETWLPQFKFLGLGLGLMAILMALGTIAKRLRHMGATITGHISAAMRLAMPPIPTRVRVFQASTMMGWMVLLAVSVIGIVLATNLVPSYWTHSIANELNQVESGSALLRQQGVVQSFHFWLNPLRMAGMAFIFFSGITLALTVIITTLRSQANLLVNFYRQTTQA